MKFIIKSSLFIMMLAFSASSFAEISEAELKSLKQGLIKRLPQAADAQINSTPLPGIYEVVSGGQVMYMDKQARYIIDGSLFDMEQRENLTEKTRGGIRLQALSDLGEDNMVVYKPEGDVRHTITVFTDIYCPYCQRLHDEMSEYQKNGVKVRYIFVPFKGEKSVATSVSVWCAKDQNAALDKAKSGQSVETKKCDNPINQHQALASQLGIRGTPAIMLESGQLMPGYVPAAKLIQQMDSK